MLTLSGSALTLTPALIVCCVSVPRDGLYRRKMFVCLSVWPSVRRNYGEIANKLSNRRLPHQCHYSGFFFTKRYRNSPTRTPPTGGVKCKGCMKKLSLLASLVKHLQSVTRGNCTERTNVEWLSEIFNDAKHRAISLRQLSFLSASVVLGNTAYPNPLFDSFYGQF